MNITILIKTFQRKHSLWNMLSSIEGFFKNTPIIIVDDSKKTYMIETLKKFPNLEINYITTEYDIGLSKGRNILLSNCQTEFFLLCDDDYIFDESTNLVKGIEILKEKNLDILAGAVDNYFKLNSFVNLLSLIKDPSKIKTIINNIPKRSVFNGFFSYEDNNDKKVILKIDRNNSNFIDENYYPSHIVNNFFIARTKSIQKLNGWQPEKIKMGEHQMFFLRAWQAGLKVAYTNLFSTEHYSKRNFSYLFMRNRSPRFFQEALESSVLISYKEIDQNTGITVVDYTK